MNFINKIRAARLDGKAIKCFNLGMYDKVIDYLEKAIEIDKEQSRNEIRNYYLGLSYIKVGISNKANSSLFVAFNALAKRLRKNGTFYDKFVNLSKNYVDFLITNGDVKLAKNIIEQTETLLTSKGYELDPERIRIIVEKDNKENK